MIATMKVVLISLLLVVGAWGAEKGKTRAPLDEVFGYVEVRPGANMFWVTYSVDQPGDWTDYPLILWLQGGPGASGVGYGNFEELGPYYVDGSLREAAWTKKANLMFVDNPVGTGYSYVTNIGLMATTNLEIADDLVTLVKSVFADNPDFAVMPFFVYCESYGGKMNADFALALDKAIKNGELDIDFRGVALGDSWISPMDSVNTWGPFLYSMGFVNAEGEAKINAAAARTQQAVDAENWELATDLWGNTENVVFEQTNGVNFYNVLATADIYKSKPHSRDLSYMRPAVRDLFNNHVRSPLTRDSLGNLMNGEMADRWNIPDDVVWDGQGGYVFNALAGDFMKPVINSVVQLLETTDLSINIYTGDLDLICDTPGTYRWIENMDWSGLADFNNVRRNNFYVPEYSSQAGYVQTSGNFQVFTILRSGHMVPIDVPSAALVMIDMITEHASSKTAKPAASKNVKAKMDKKLKESTDDKQTEDKLPKKAEETKAKVAAPVKAEVAPAKAPAAETPAGHPKIAAAHVKLAAAVKTAAKEAHLPLVDTVPHSHVTPTGAKFGKQDAISRKLKKKPLKTFGLGNNH